MRGHGEGVLVGNEAVVLTDPRRLRVMVGLVGRLDGGKNAGQAAFWF